MLQPQEQQLAQSLTKKEPLPRGFRWSPWDSVPLSVKLWHLRQAGAWDPLLEYLHLCLGKCLLKQRAHVHGWGKLRTKAARWPQTNCHFWGDGGKSRTLCTHPQQGVGHSSSPTRQAAPTFTHSRNHPALLGGGAGYLILVLFLSFVLQHESQ